MGAPERTALLNSQPRKNKNSAEQKILYPDGIWNIQTSWGAASRLSLLYRNFRKSWERDIYRSFIREASESDGVSNMSKFSKRLRTSDYKLWNFSTLFGHDDV